MKSVVKASVRMNLTAVMVPIFISFSVRQRCFVCSYVSLRSTLWMRISRAVSVMNIASVVRMARFMVLSFVL